MSLPNLHSTTFDRPRPSSRLQPLTSPSFHSSFHSSSSSSLSHPSPHSELTFASPLPLTPSTPSSYPTSTPLTSSLLKSSSLELCHVCGVEFKKAHLGVHRRSCIRKSMGRLATAHSASALASSPGCHPCFKCLQHIPSHLFSNHMQSCPGQQLKPLSSSSSSSPPPSSSSHFNSLHHPSSLTSSSPTWTPSHTNSILPLKLTTITKLDSGVDIPTSHFSNNHTHSFPLPSPPPSSSSSSSSTSVSGFIPVFNDPLPHPSHTTATGSLQSSYTHESDLMLSDKRQPCPLCQRKFKVDVLDRHVQACEKLHSKKRHVFDMQSKRVKGTDMEKFVLKSNTTSTTTSSSSVMTMSKSKKKKHPQVQEEEHLQEEAELIEHPEIRGMDRSVPKFKKKSNGVSLPHPTQLSSPATHSSSSSSSGSGSGVQARFKFAADRIALDYITCPTCLRRFNQEAAERHLEFCKQAKESQWFKPKPNPEKLSKEERLLKRTQYQPPPPMTSSSAKHKNQKPVPSKTSPSNEAHLNGKGATHLSSLSPLTIKNQMKRDGNESSIHSGCLKCGHRLLPNANFCASCGMHR